MTALDRTPGPLGRDELRRLFDRDLAPRLRAAEEARGEGRAEALRGLVSDLAGRVLPGARFGPQGAASQTDVLFSGIFGERAEHCESRAGIVGAARPPGLVFAEIRLYAVSEWYDAAYHGSTSRRGGVSVNRRRETDVFRGLFIAFDLGTAVRGATFVDPRRVGPAIASRDALDAVGTDGAFERVFRVSSSDPDEARALLMPSTRAGLLRLHEAADRHAIHVAIAGGRVSIALELGCGLFEPAPPMDFERVAAIAGLFGLVERAAAALPVGVPLPAAAANAGAPSRPATSDTRLTRHEGGLTLAYTRAVSPLRLALSGLAAPFLVWFGFLAAQALLASKGEDSGALAAMIPLAVGMLIWLYAAQDWWGPVTRVEVGRGELRVRRGLLRWTRVPVASVGSLDARDGMLHAGRLPVSPRLPGEELRWLGHELGEALK